MSYEESLDALRQIGQQYPDEIQRVAPLGEGLTHISRRGVPKVTAVDEMALLETDHVYTNDSQIRGALAEHGAAPSGPVRAALFIGRALMRRKPILGFSGYATSGFPYAQEANGVEAVLGHLEGMGMSPDLVVDGGTRVGVPGLSGLMSKHHGATTLGITPRQGLDDIAPRDHLIVQGKQYGEETSLVGSIPDILVVLGGGPNGKKEYQAALKNGGSVLMLVLKDYPKDSLANLYKDVPETAKALQTGRLAVCESFEDIPTSLGLLFEQVGDLRCARIKRIMPILRALATSNSR